MTTDILFLRKYAPGATSTGHAFHKLAMIDSLTGRLRSMNTTPATPEMMLGQMKLEGTMYRGAEPTLEGQLTSDLLRRAIEALPEGAYIPRDEARGPPLVVLGPDAFTGVKDGAYALREGVLVIRNGNSFEPTSLSVSAEMRIKGMMAVRDAVRLVFRTQLEDAPDERIIEARKLLNTIYDSFVSRYSPLSSRDNLRAFASDPDQPLLLSLEIYDAETRHAQKSAIFERRTLERHKARSTSRPPLRRWRSPSMRSEEFIGRSWRSSRGKAPRHLQRELDSLVYPQPPRRMGNRRLLFKRQRAREAQDRRGRCQSRSLLPTAATLKP